MKVTLALLLTLFGCKPTHSPSTPLLVGTALPAAKDFDATVHMGSCSGVKIAPKIYMTAKHCVSENGWVVGRSVVLVRKRAGQRESSVEGKIVLVRPYADDDVALVKISGADGAIPTAEIAEGTDPKSQKVVMSGYGCVEMFVAEGKLLVGDRGDDTLRTVAATVERNAFGEPTASEKNLYVKAKAKKMMGGDREIQGPALCPGDSGGPLWIESNRKMKVWGVASGFHTALLSSVFVRVDPKSALGASGWLKKELASLR